MKIQFRCIASGSNGNCAYISTPEGVLLVDAGISTRRILNALSEDKIRSKDILGICVSHAHSDHIMGLPVLSTRLKVPVLCSTETKTILQRFNRYDRRWNAIAQHSINFDFNKAFTIGPFTIKMIKTIHDVEGSTSFQIGYNDEFITTLTDTGQLLSHHIKSMAESFLVLLEMNHDIPSLIASRRPFWLKKRIRAVHLANIEALAPVEKSLLDSHVKALLVGHLSGECNSPSLVASEILNWSEGQSWPWDWYICRRDESGKKLIYDGFKITTAMRDISRYEENSARISQRRIIDYI